MTKGDAEDFIRERKGNALSVDEQVEISHTMCEQGFTRDEEGIKIEDIEETLGLDLEYDAKTSINHLRDIDVVVGNSPAGPEFYAISESRDKIINGDVDEVAEGEVELLIEDMRAEDPAEEEPPLALDGGEVTIRHVLADQFDIVPGSVERHLRTGDQVDKLNDAVDAIENHDEVSKNEDYGKIIFRRGANRYTLTEEQVDRYEA